MKSLYIPQWQKPSSVQAFFTFRHGGVSDPPHHSFNLAVHVGDDYGSVGENRLRLQQSLPSSPKWLRQGHTGRVVHADEVEADSTVADAAYTFTDNTICVITVADCLPVLLCTADGKGVAAAHAGWRGLAADVIENTAATLRTDNKNEELIAWIGPSIMATNYEVGEDVREALGRDEIERECFKSLGDNKYLADLQRLAGIRLQKLGISFACDNICTYGDSKQFFSARRDGIRSGRMAALIWIGK